MLALSRNSDSLRFKTCCLTDLFLEEALEKAKDLDEHLRQTGKTVGPLHGLPISAKVRFESEPGAGHANLNSEHHDCSRIKYSSPEK